MNKKKEEREEGEQEEERDGEEEKVSEIKSEEEEEAKRVAKRVAKRAAKRGEEEKVSPKPPQTQLQKKEEREAEQQEEREGEEEKVSRNKRVEPILSAKHRAYKKLLQTQQKKQQAQETTAPAPTPMEMQMLREWEEHMVDTISAQRFSWKSHFRADASVKHMVRRKAYLEKFKLKMQNLFDRAIPTDELHSLTSIFIPEIDLYIAQADDVIETHKKQVEENLAKAMADSKRKVEQGKSGKNAKQTTKKKEVVKESLTRQAESIEQPTSPGGTPVPSLEKITEFLENLAQQGVTEIKLAPQGVNEENITELMVKLAEHAQMQVIKKKKKNRNIQKIYK